jgi:plastocyanin
MAVAAAGLGLNLLLSACLPAAQSPQQTTTATVERTVAPTAAPVSGAAPIPVAAPTLGGAVPTLVGGVAAAKATPVGTTVSAPAVAIRASISLSPDRQFSPPLLTIEVGQAIRWVNDSRSPQTVTCDPALVVDKSLVVLPDGAQPFASAGLNAGDAFVHVFDTPGDYQYVSLPFEAEMVGRVSVRG